MKKLRQEVIGVIFLGALCWISFNLVMLGVWMTKALWLAVFG